MSTKDDALQQIIAITQQHAITTAEITAAMVNARGQAATASAGSMSRLFGYIGSIFVFSGICAFIAMFWDELGSAARVTITLGAGYLIFIMAFACLKNERYQRVAIPFFIISTVLQPLGIFVMLDQYFHGGIPQHDMLFMATLMLIQHGATFWHTRQTVLAFTSILFGCIFFATLFDMWGLNDNLIGIVGGTSVLCIAYALTNSRHAYIADFWYIAGSVSLLWSSFDALERTRFEIFFPAIAGFLIYLSIQARSRALLVISTVSMIGYISYFTSEHFADTLGWPIALIICGLSFIGLGSLAVKLNNKYIKQT